MSDCPCGSGEAYESCCQPYITGTAAAQTAVALMRSRYTAYTLANIDYLRESLHPDHREDFDADMAQKWAQESDWLGLEIKEVSEGGVADTSGTVEFVARYTEDGKPTDHHELAYFEKVENRWYFLDGRLIHETYRRETPKVGRNEPCPCGSGKKYKKCCA